MCQLTYGGETCKFRLGVPGAVQIPQPLLEAVVITVLSHTHSTTSENFFIKRGRKKKKPLAKRDNKSLQETVILTAVCTQITQNGCLSVATMEPLMI